MNPLLSADQAQQVETLFVTCLLTYCRAGHMSRSSSLVASLIALLKSCYATSNLEASVTAVALKAEAVAESLTTRRAYVAKGSASYDPRLLVFEFNCNMILRESQVKLVQKFVKAHGSGKSLCHQLIMGAGKTTVIAPLLALMLASSDTSIVQVVPAQLVEMTRAVMRNRFSALVQKPVYTFVFDRADTIDEALLSKLLKARASRAVMVASPTSIKSFVLKFTEILHLLHEDATSSTTGFSPKPKNFFNFMGLGPKGSASEGGGLSSDEIESYQAQAALFPQIIQVFQVCVRVCVCVRACVRACVCVLHVKSQVCITFGRREEAHSMLHIAHWILHRHDTLHVAIHTTHDTRHTTHDTRYQVVLFSIKPP